MCRLEAEPQRMMQVSPARGWILNTVTSEISRVTSLSWQIFPSRDVFTLRCFTFVYVFFVKSAQKSTWSKDLEIQRSLENQCGISLPACCGILASQYILSILSRVFLSLLRAFSTFQTFRLKSQETNVSWNVCIGGSMFSLVFLPRLSRWCRSGSDRLDPHQVPCTAAAEGSRATWAPSNTHRRPARKENIPIVLWKL